MKLQAPKVPCNLPIFASLDNQREKGPKILENSVRRQCSVLVKGTDMPDCLSAPLSAT